jgi:hypothetical protein
MISTSQLLLAVPYFRKGTLYANWVKSLDLQPRYELMNPVIRAFNFEVRRYEDLHQSVIEPMLILAYLPTASVTAI